MNHRILVVDDNAAIHEDIRKILAPPKPVSASLEDAEALLFGQSTEVEARTGVSFDIDSAFQGQEGLELVRKSLEAGRPYALAFVDVRMPPGWDGVETISRIWSIYPELQVVICTAYSDYSWDDFTAQLGHSDSVLILKKPFDNIEVLQMAHALTKKWFLTQEAKSQLQNLDKMVNERTAELRVANQRLTQEMAERTQAENQLRQAQKMEAVGHLAAGVAHDFRNILTVIHGNASLRLLNPELDARTRDSLKQIIQSVERAANLTQQLLAFSRKQIMRMEVVDINNLLRHVSEMLARVIGEHITLEYHYADALPASEADVCSIEQVILNLAVNARDAMPQGGTLTISTSRVEVNESFASSHADTTAGEFVCITVADTGCGMNEHTLEHLFEPFFTTKEVGKGTGMGLATAYGLVKQHKGWIDVESRVGSGSTFKIFLPASKKQPKAEETAPATRPAAGGKETILLVEDEELVREFVSSLLSECGYKVRQASNGAEAMDIWKQCSAEIDLLLTDVVMPQKISGIELADKLCQDKQDLKVIFTSGYSLELLEEHFQSRRGLNFLPKPYAPAKLTELIRVCLDK